MSKLFKKTLIISVILFGLVANATSLYSGWLLYRKLTDEYTSKAIAIADSIASSSLEIFLNRDAATIQSIIDQYTETAGVAYVLVSFRDDGIVAHTFVPKVPDEILAVVTSSETQTREAVVTSNIRTGSGGRFLNVSSPILSGQAGYVHVGMNLKNLQTHIWSAIIKLQLITLGIFATCVIFLFFFINRISQPLTRLTEYANRVAAHDFSSPVRIRSEDEIGVLAYAMTYMAEELEAHITGLEHKVSSATKELQDTITYVRAIINNLSEGLIVVDAGGDVTQYNSAFAGIFDIDESYHGADARQLLGEDIFALVGKKRNILSEYVKEKTRAGKDKGDASHRTTFLGNHPESQPVEITAAARSGRTFPMELSVSVVYLKRQWHAICVMRDITERKRVEERLRESEEKYRSFVEQANDGIAIFQNNAFKYANPQLCELLGRAMDDMIGAPVDACVADEERGKVRALYADGGGMNRNRQINIETRLLHRNGREIDVEINSGAISFESRPANLVFIRDIRERKRREAEIRSARQAAEQASLAKSEFLANMSHEIRTPLNGVIAAAELILSETLPPKIESYTRIIESSAHALLGIINDILDFSKIEAGKLELEYRPFQLYDVLDGIADMFKSKSSEKMIEFLIDAEPDAPNALIGDAMRLQQILINLAGNAFKFTGKGGVIIIRVKPLKTSDHYASLLFSVSDDGPGISPEKKEHLFQPFTQADASTTRKYGGSGLGLSICKQMIQLMNGDIWVESEPGKGATFHVSLEFKRQPRENEEKLVFPPDLRKLKVLVTDDREESRQIMKKMLACFGFSCDLASSGVEAFEKVKARKETPYDLIVMDWLMSEMDGIETAKMIRNIDARAPIILMTAFGEKIVKNDIENVRINAFLTKPICQSALFNAIMDVFGKKEPAAPRNGELLVTRLTVYKTRLAGLRVLVAEDNLTNQEIIQAVLEDAGVAADIAGNGAEAVAALRENVFDAVLMDIQMPVMDGLAATREIRSLENAGAIAGGRTPIIAITAHAMKGDEEKILAAGMDAYVSKPINQERLFHTLWKCTRQRADKKEKESEAAPASNPAPADGVSAPRPLKNLPLALPGLAIQDAMNELGISTEKFGRILYGYFVDNADTEGKLRRALETEDRDALIGAAHALKGSSGMIGAYALQKAAYRLEMLGREGPVRSEGPAAVDDVASALDVVLKSLGLLFEKD